MPAPRFTGLAAAGFVLAALAVPGAASAHPASCDQALRVPVPMTGTSNLTLDITPLGCDFSATPAVPDVPADPPAPANPAQRKRAKKASCGRAGKKSSPARRCHKKR
jgi:hypothetical protein